MNTFAALPPMTRDDGLSTETRDEHAIASRARATSHVVALVGPPAAIEAAARTTAEALGVEVVDVGLTLSRALRDVLPRHRPVRTERILLDLMPDAAAVLIRTEILFEPALAVRPLEILRRLRRSRPVVVHWPGAFDGEHLSYAHAGHPEHVREPADGVTVVTLSAA